MTKVFSEPDVLLNLANELSIKIPPAQKPVLVIGMTIQSMQDEVLDQVAKQKDKVRFYTFVPPYVIHSKPKDPLPYPVINCCLLFFVMESCILFFFF